jgi:hypothetical protein
MMTDIIRKTNTQDHQPDDSHGLSDLGCKQYLRPVGVGESSHGYITVELIRGGALAPRSDGANC